MAQRTEGRPGKSGAEAGEGDLLTLAEAAQVLGVSARTAQRLLDREELKGIKVGRQWRFRKADLAAYLDRERAPFTYPPEADMRDALASLEGALGSLEAALA